MYNVTRLRSLKLLFFFTHTGIQLTRNLLYEMARTGSSSFPGFSGFSLSNVNNIEIHESSLEKLLLLTSQRVKMYKHNILMHSRGDSVSSYRDSLEGRITKVIQNIQFKKGIHIKSSFHLQDKTPPVKCWTSVTICDIKIGKLHQNSSQMQVSKFLQGCSVHTQGIQVERRQYGWILKRPSIVIVLLSFINLHNYSNLLICNLSSI